MKLLLIGGGGREHALAWKLAQDRLHPELFCAPGNAGTAELGVNLDLQAEDVEGLLNWAMQEKPHLTVVGPEAPLSAGLVDRFESEQLRVFGPCQAAAQLESSKIFSKDVLCSAGIPTGRAKSFSEFEQAQACIKSVDLPIVVKADGLAAGKGVTICFDRDQAEEAIRAAMVDQIFGESGRNVMIEEYLEGDEVSMIALVDGDHAVLLPSAQDHKRALDGDHGPNTGGMGAYSPAPMESPQLRETVMEHIVKPTIAELRRRGIRYHGVLYTGLMITSEGPKVLEFNCRFGDPETQAILPRLTGDLIPVLEACIDGNLKPEHVTCHPEHCVCVVMTAGGYPGAYRKGDVIRGLQEAAVMKDVFIFHAGTRLEQGHILTAGGRVLGITALGSNLASAAERAYQAVSTVSFDNAHFRRDIAARGLKGTTI